MKTCDRESGKTPLLRLLRSWLPSSLTLSTLAQVGCKNKMDTKGWSSTPPLRSSTMWSEHSAATSASQNPLHLSSSTNQISSPIFFKVLTHSQLWYSCVNILVCNAIWSPCYRERFYEKVCFLGCISLLLRTVKNSFLPTENGNRLGLFPSFQGDRSWKR